MRTRNRGCLDLEPGSGGRRGPSARKEPGGARVWGGDSTLGARGPARGLAHEI